jgi:hypothetical protein
MKNRIFPSIFEMYLRDSLFLPKSNIHEECPELDINCISYGISFE